MVAVSDQDVLLGGEGGLELNGSMVIEPAEVPILVLVLVEFLKLGCTEFHLRRKGTSSSVLLRPMPIGKNLCVEFNTIHNTVTILLLELVH